MGANSILLPIKKRNWKIYFVISNNLVQSTSYFRTRVEETSRMSSASCTLGLLPSRWALKMGLMSLLTTLECFRHPDYNPWQRWPCHWASLVWCWLWRRWSTKRIRRKRYSRGATRWSKATWLIHAQKMWRPYPLRLTLNGVHAPHKADLCLLSL